MNELNAYVGTGNNGTGYPELLGRYMSKFNAPAVGASGAVYGILLAFGMIFPNRYIYLYFAIPVKAKYLVAGLAALQLYSAIENDPNNNVAHFCAFRRYAFRIFTYQSLEKKPVPTVLKWQESKMKY